MPMVDADGVRLHVKEYGDPARAVVVIIPGLGADHRQFAGLAQDLAGSWRVLVVDPRGAGMSDAPQGPYSIETMSHDLAAIIVQLGLQAPAVVGYSMGGRVALQLAAQRPDLLGRLVLAATSARTVRPRPLSTRWFALSVLPLIRLPKAIDDQPQAAFRSQRDASRRFDGRPLLPHIQVPTCIISAAHDRMVPRHLSHELMAIATAEHVVLPGGHMSLLMRHHRQLADAITMFLARH